MPSTKMTFNNRSVHFNSFTLSDHTATDGQKWTVKEKNHEDFISAGSLTHPEKTYIDLLLFVNLLELLVINHSLSERRNIFVLWWLKLSCVLVILQLPWVHTSSQLIWITSSNLALCLTLYMVSGYLWHHFKWTRWFGCVLQYSSGL